MLDLKCRRLKAAAASLTCELGHNSSAGPLHFQARLECRPSRLGVLLFFQSASLVQHLAAASARVGGSQGPGGGEGVTSSGPAHQQLRCDGCSDPVDVVDGSSKPVRLELLHIPGKQAVVLIWCVCVCACARAAVLFFNQVKAPSKSLTVCGFQSSDGIFSLFATVVPLFVPLPVFLELETLNHLSMEEEKYVSVTIKQTKVQSKSLKCSS